MRSTQKLGFASDYMQGAQPAVLERLVETNMVACAGYGADEFSESARNKIRQECNAPEAEIYFLVGGTQTNAVVLGTLLAPYQGVIAAKTGHISIHEAGAIEAGGHKVIELESAEGKLSAADVKAAYNAWAGDENRDHMVMPAAVYISQPTEYGSLYSLAELEAIAAVCKDAGLYLYVDGARLAYALAADENDVSLADLAHLCDAFYIGGTKCGTLLGEAVVFPDPLVPHFVSIAKQEGALLAKSRVCGVQFDALFSDGLYFKIGKGAVEQANLIRACLDECGYKQPLHAPTNQVFVSLTSEQYEALSKQVEMSFWEKLADDRTVVRIATSWATSDEDVSRLLEVLKEAAI